MLLFPQCPKCNICIEKNGGCNHMVSNWPRQTFLIISRIFFFPHFPLTSVSCLFFFSNAPNASMVSRIWEQVSLQCLLVMMFASLFFLWYEDKLWILTERFFPLVKGEQDINYRLVCDSFIFTFFSLAAISAGFWFSAGLAPSPWYVHCIEKSPSLP